LWLTSVAHRRGGLPGQPWFRRVTVESRTVTTAGYDDRSSTMELEFVDGGVYRYFVVPRSVFDALLAADSIGRFFHDHIRGVYPFTRIR
jgi:hypothetical protein